MSALVTEIATCCAVSRVLHCSCTVTRFIMLLSSMSRQEAFQCRISTFNAHGCLKHSDSVLVIVLLTMEAGQSCRRYVGQRTRMQALPLSRPCIRSILRNTTKSAINRCMLSAVLYLKCIISAKVAESTVLPSSTTLCTFPDCNMDMKHRSPSRTRSEPLNY